MTTSHSPAIRCKVSTDGFPYEHLHECTKGLDHRQRDEPDADVHLCSCGARWRTERLTPPTNPPKPKYGERVRVACSATGRYLGDGWALFVSAMDNSLNVDRVDPVGLLLPHPTLPVPSDDALEGAVAVYRNARVMAAAEKQGGQA